MPCAIPKPICPACHTKMQVTMMMPLGDGATEWRFRCVVCKVDKVIVEKASPDRQRPADGTPLNR
jgi:hypothetical protein